MHLKNVQKCTIKKYQRCSKNAHCVLKKTKTFVKIIIMKTVKKKRKSKKTRRKLRKTRKKQKKSKNITKERKTKITNKKTNGK